MMPLAADNYHGVHNHYGLIREGEREYKALCSLPGLEEALPPVDISILPESMGVSEWMQIENQASLGSCVGHGRSSVAELCTWFETGEKLQLNRMFSYITAQKESGIVGDRGATIEGAARAASNYGECLESLWPYSGRYTTAIPQACYDDAAKRKLRTFRTMENYDQCLRWLAHGVGGLLIGIGWNAYCEPDGQGRITKYRSGGGGHALALVDWSMKHADTMGRPSILMANSWGRSWGENGFAFVFSAVVDYWCKSETVIGFTDYDGEAIKPRKLKLTP